MLCLFNSFFLRIVFRSRENYIYVYNVIFVILYVFFVDYCVFWYYWFDFVNNYFVLLLICGNFFVFLVESFGYDKKWAA